MQTDVAIPRKAPARSSSRKRATIRQSPTNPTLAQQHHRQAQIHAFRDLKKSPALKLARITRMRRLNVARWAAAQAQIPVQWRALLVIFRVIIMSLVLFVMFRIMVQEKHLLQLKALLTRQRYTMKTTKISWRSFTHSYETRFRRTTPTTLEPWLAFAQENDCDTFKLYQAIERDLLPFRHHLVNIEGQDPIHQLLHWDNQLQEIATNYTKGAYMLVEINNHKVTILERQLDEWFQQHPTVHTQTSWRGWWEIQKLEWNLQWLLDPLRHHTPPLTTRLVINLHSRPKSPPNAMVPIFSSHSESYHTQDDPTHPGNLSLEISNKNRNGVIDTRDRTTRDLLLPHLYIAGGRVGTAGMTSSPAIGGFWFWPFYREGIPWQKRRNTIVWRGSTLGNFEQSTSNNNKNKNKNNNKTQHDFFSGPRFTMMQTWGGTSVHPVQAESQVQVDFAFTNVLLQGEEKMDQAQKDAITAAVKKEYRFAPRLSFRQLQKHKYLMDVDGNGTLDYLASRDRLLSNLSVLLYRLYPANHLTLSHSFPCFLFFSSIFGTIFGTHAKWITHFQSNTVS
jgi:hypothetical protein